MINSMEEDVTKKVLSMFDKGIDIAYEAAGVEATFTSALNVLKKGGQLMVIAAFAKPVSLNVSQLLIGELKVTASLAYRHIFPEVISMIATGRLDVKPVITKKISLDHLVEDGLELLIKDKSQSKILVEIQN